MIKLIICVVVTMMSGNAIGVSAAESKPVNEHSKPPVVMEKVVVDKVWSGVPVRYCLLTHGKVQYVVYYDSDRNMAVAQRKLSEKTFTKKVLPSKQGWDSHNYITMAVDTEGYLHISGNMHARRLVYFRSQKPGDITSMVRIKSMVGKKENRCTYPTFMKTASGELIFHYRDGGSGNGVEVYNIYDVKTKTWKRFLDKPLASGGGKRNAYGGPRMGADGWFHFVWMWRNTPDCSTTNNISYARSKDLIHWENAAGDALALPITITSKGTIVDPVPVRGGLLNMGNGVGFDSKKRVLITYHKNDKEGYAQAYAARFEDGKWVIHQLTNWKHKWHFKGGGSISCDVSVGNPEPHGDGKLVMPYRHVKFGSGLFILDEETLKVLGTEPEPPKYPKALTAVTSGFKGMQVNWFGDIGKSPEASSTYVLRWETLGRNRDRPRKGKLPKNGDLVLYGIGSEGGTK